MNKTSQTLITIAIVLAGAMLASAVMVKFTPMLRGWRLSGGQSSLLPFKHRFYLFSQPKIVV